MTKTKKNKNKHLINFSIGDWSNDGHGKENQYVVESSLPGQDLREIYFKACEKLGVRLDGGDTKGQTKWEPPCSEYEDGHFPIDIYNHLIEFGVKLPKIEMEDEEDVVEPYLAPEPEQFINIVLAVIRWGGPKDLKLVLLEPEDFHFYGFDNKERHIGYFGYGLFA